MAAIPVALCVSHRSGRSSEPSCEAGTHPRDGQGFVCHQAHTLTGLQSWHRAKAQLEMAMAEPATRAYCSKTMPRRGQPLPASCGRLSAISCAPGPTWSRAVQLGRLSRRVDSGTALKAHLGAVEGATPPVQEAGLMRMILSKGVWSASASSNRVYQTRFMG